jgi:CBS domain-containing protein
MVPDPLQQPVGALMRHCARLQSEDSIQTAAEVLRDEGVELIVVVEGDRLRGVVSQQSLAQALGEGRQPSESVMTAAASPAAVLRPYSTGAEALRTFAFTGGAPVVVLDEMERVLGVVGPADLYPRRAVQVRPPLIGGMATPFGVYLTTGSISAGAGGLALIATGMLLFSLITGASFAADYLASFVRNAGSAAKVADILSVGLFAIGLRLIPLSGIHAAEHKVVHAIERGEELTPAIVKRMPRVHPRCGTNIAVGASLFVSLATANFIPIREFQLLFALVATIALWRPLGGLVQMLVTTRPPSDRQIDMGIRAGEELLAKYARSPHVRPNFATRLWNSGLFHVIVGSFLAFGLLWLILKPFGIDITV